MEIYNGDVFGGRLVVYDNGDYIFIEGRVNDLDSISTYYRFGTGPEQLRLQASRVYESYSSRSTTLSRLRERLEDNGRRLESLRDEMRTTPSPDGASTATMGHNAREDRIRIRDRSRELEAIEHDVPVTPEPVGSRFATMGHDRRDYAQLREIRERTGIVLDEGYGGRLGLKNVPEVLFNRLRGELSRISREDTTAPGGINFIELRNYHYYVWNGSSYIRDTRTEAILQNHRELETLGELLNWFSEAILIGVQIAGLATGVGAYVHAGRTLATALALTAGEVVVSEMAVGTVIEPLIEATVDDPTTQLVLNLAFGLAVGVIASHSISRIGTPRTVTPRVASPRPNLTDGALTGDVLSAEEALAESLINPTIDIRPQPRTPSRLESGTRRLPSSTETIIIDDINRGIAPESRGISTLPREPEVRRLPEGSVDDDMSAFDGPFERRRIGRSSSATRFVPTRRGRAIYEAARDDFNNNLRDMFARRLGARSFEDIHHAIELQVLRRYEDTFTAAVLNDFSNMRGIPAELLSRKQLHNAFIRSEWNRLYRRLDQLIITNALQRGTPEYRNFVRSFLFEGRDQIDYLVGQFFREQRTIVRGGWSRSRLPNDLLTMPSIDGSVR